MKQKPKALNDKNIQVQHVDTRRDLNKYIFKIIITDYYSAARREYTLR